RGESSPLRPGTDRAPVALEVQLGQGRSLEELGEGGLLFPHLLVFGEGEDDGDLDATPGQNLRAVLDRLLDDLAQLVLGLLDLPALLHEDLLLARLSR